MNHKGGCFSPDGKAAIADRKREPVVVQATPPDFAQWLNNGTAASSLELWAYKGGAWTPIPYQVDEVSLEAQDVKSFIDPTQFPGAQCQGGASGTPPNTPGPCEFLYDLRGTSPPSGSFTTNDELVFIAGTSGDCGVSTSSWPDTLLDTYRYRIQIADNAPSTESGCVYLFRRLSGSHPSVPNLVDYDPVGDGYPATCKPTSTACGTITGQGFDVDGDGTQDDPPYRMDFRGNWTADRLMIGQTARLRA